MRWLTMTTLIVALSTLTNAVKECQRDADCSSNQFCYAASHLCVDYVNCTWFHREESAKPARHANQCGPCLSGYSAEKIPEDARSEGEEKESCNLDPTIDPPKSGSTNKNSGIGSMVAVGFFSVFAVLLLVLYVVYILIRLKPCRKYADVERPSELQSIELKAITASAPPMDSIHENNNNEYNPEATGLLPYESTIGKYRGNVPVSRIMFTTAQAYHPPDWVQNDPAYNAEDNNQVETTSGPLDIDEETMTSSWTPGEPNAIPENPFAGISSEQDQNRTNTALARLACPPLSTSTESRGSRQSSGGGGNSARFNETNSNSRGNVNLINIQINNNVNQGGSGS